MENKLAPPSLVVAIALAGMAAMASLPGEGLPPAAAASGPADGIRFACQASRLPEIVRDMDALLAELGIPRGTVVRRASRREATYTLATPAADTATLDLAERPEYRIASEAVALPGAKGVRLLLTVSRREILLALLQHGRLTELTGPACSVAALRHHIGLRQNIVAWTEQLEWGWPDGGPARWNPRYWDAGTPVPGHSLEEALLDIFRRPDQYAFGCYTATKVVVVQGVLDYYRRVAPDPERLGRAEARLLADGEPLADIEPGAMWAFEADADPGSLSRPGKLVRLLAGVPARNFVPGDWAYFVNSDPESRQKTGYEGSSTIYLGRGRFADFFNDHQHSYTYLEKLDEVYQWRHGVFSRSRDADKRVPMTEAALERLAAVPEEGGLVLALRAVPAD